MTISDQRSRSKLYAAKIPQKIHGALSEVCVEFTLGRRTVSPWANSFRGGCVSTDNDPRSGRPRTSADERSVKLVADALEEDRRATCEEQLSNQVLHYEAHSQRLRHQTKHKNQRTASTTFHVNVGNDT